MQPFQFSLEHSVASVPRMRATSSKQQHLLANILESRARAFARGNHAEEAILRELLLDASATYL